MKEETKMFKTLWAFWAGLKQRVIRPTPTTPVAAAPATIASPATPTNEIRSYRVRDIRIDPVTWGTIYRWLLSTLGGFTAASIVWIISVILDQFTTGTTNVIGSRLFFLIALLGFVLFVWDEPLELDAEGKPKSIAKIAGTNNGRLITLFGMVTPFIHTTGDYPWIGRRLRLGWADKIEPTFTDAVGNLKLGGATLQVWNQPGDTDNVKRLEIVAMAKNQASTTTNITAKMLPGEKARGVLDIDDATLLIADRFRQEWRELTAWFVDTDLPKLMGDLEPLLRGRTLITCFLPKSLGKEKVGAMITDRSNMAIYRLVESDADIEAEIVNFIEEVKLRADVEMYKAVKFQRKRKVTIVVTIVKVLKPVTEVIESLGWTLSEIIFGDIQMSQKVKDAADQASAEANERQAEIEDAHTKAAARTILLPTDAEAGNPGFELAQILASQQGGNNNGAIVVYATGNSSGSLTSGLVAAAQQLKGDGTK
jgi:hypothetical protein